MHRHAPGPDRQFRWRITGFRGCRGDRVKADVGEEDDTRGGQQSAVSVLARTYVLRNERMPVRRVDVPDTEADEEQHYRYFDGDNDGVEARGLSDADVTDHRQCRDNRHCGHVDDCAGPHDLELTDALGKGS